MNTTIVFSQNLILESLQNILDKMRAEGTVVFITTHYLFENERRFLTALFDNCIFHSFSDYITDDEMEACDNRAYVNSKIEYSEYINNVKKLKNRIIVKKVENKYSPEKKYILSDDLGIDYNEWKAEGYKFVFGDYYYREPKKSISITNIIKSKLKDSIVIYNLYRLIKGSKIKNSYNSDEIAVAYYNDRKFVFIGKQDRIAYRFGISFASSDEEHSRLCEGEYETKDCCTYITTWHERYKCKVPDDQRYDVRWVQDGYLPPNYSHKDYYFKPGNVSYYCWDHLGTLLFKNQGLPYEIIPFRKKLYLPEPVFPRTVKNVLIVASGSGDWTALKNRSDDDLLVDAFVKIARQFPEIEFTYRCHPTWIHPLNVGVNSINRVGNYFKDACLSNLHLSSNIPNPSCETGFAFSFSRSSLDEDLANADFVFGEHSISMIDAAFKQIPFSSVNLTNRRNFFVGINDLGFPLCSSIEDIATVISNAGTEEFQRKYNEAVKNYNIMTDEQA